MHVVATAGHVDHGKSTLIRALTGMEPDRLAEERRRGLTLDLGFAWMTLDSGEHIAFVDVPGHERFVPTMLAGVGPVPAVLFVVAADEGWRRQSAEHLAALEALGVTRGVLAVTRSDLADPAPALDSAARELAAAGLLGCEGVAVSGATGAGLDDLRAALGRLAAALPAPDPAAPVRLWIDRAFTIRGAGTVVTGTLPAGTVAVGDELDIGGRRVRVRALESLKRRGESVSGVARVAVNLRGVERDEVRRGEALTTPGAWWPTEQVDVALTAPMQDGGGRDLVLHIGSAAVAVRVRMLGPVHARLRLDRPLPLHVGDRALLRDPGAHAIAAGVRVLDVDPPALDRRGAARSRAGVLAGMAAGDGGWRGEVSRRGFARTDALRAMGVAVHREAEAEAVGGWLVDPPLRERLRRELAAAVREHATTHPLDGGMPAAAAQQRLHLPDARLLAGLADGIATMRDGRLVSGDGSPRLPDGVRVLRERLADAPYAAPEAADLVALGLHERELAAAVRAGALARLAPGVFLAPEAVDKAPAALAALPQPFTISEARRALGTTRRVAVPLLELLDRRGNTTRIDAVARRVVRL